MDKGWVMLNNDQQNNDFIDSIFSPDFLDLATRWINENLSPEDVFSCKQLSQWAYDNGFKKFE